MVLPPLPWLLGGAGVVLLLGGYLLMRKSAESAAAAAPATSPAASGPRTVLLPIPHAALGQMHVGALADAAAMQALQDLERLRRSTSLRCEGLAYGGSR